MKWRMFSVLICCAFLFSATAYADIYKLTLNGLEIGLDKGNGCIVSLWHPKVGQILKCEPNDGGLLDIGYPIEGCAQMRLAARFSKARLEPLEHGIKIIYNSLGPSRNDPALPPGCLSAIVEIKAADDNRSVIISAEIENKSQKSIYQVLFPDLHGLVPFAGRQQTILTMGQGAVAPFIQPRKDPDTTPWYGAKPENTGWHVYPADCYGYGPNTLRWIDFGSLAGGISIFQKTWRTPDRLDLLTHVTELAPDRMRLCFDQHNCFYDISLQPGQKLKSAQYWLTPHEGGWAKGIEVYRDYVKQVRPSHQLPKHIAEGLGFQSIWMMQGRENDPAYADFTYADLPKVAEDAARHGINEICPWGWCNYSRLPITIRPQLGTEQDLLDGICKARKLGVNITPFISIQMINLKYLDRYGKHPDWPTSEYTYGMDFVPPYNPHYVKDHNLAGRGKIMDANISLWQQDVLASLTDWQKKGLTSVCWDGFTSQKGGHDEAVLVAFAKEIRERCSQFDPNAVFAGELCNLNSLEFTGQVLDYTWNWANYTDCGPILNILTQPRLNCNIEDSSLVVKKCFADGLYMNLMPRKPDRPNSTALISDVPALSAAVKQAAKLRKQFLPYFTDGTFISNCILRESAPFFIRTHVLKDSLLIIVLNDSNAPAKKTAVTIDPRLWLESGNYTLSHYNQDGKLIKVATISVKKDAAQSLKLPSLAPLEMVFYEMTRSSSH